MLKTVGVVLVALALLLMSVLSTASAAAAPASTAVEEADAPAAVSAQATMVLFGFLTFSPRADHDAARPAGDGPAPAPSRAGGTQATRPMGLQRVLRDVLDTLLHLLGMVGGWAVALWHRIDPSDLLVNPTRRHLLDVVRAEPGLSATALGTRLGVHRKSVVYHLRRLEDARLVRVERHGRVLAVFPPGVASKQPITTRQRIVEALTRGEHSRAALAHLLDVTPQAIGQHLAAIARDRPLRTRRRGGRTLYRL